MWRRLICAPLCVALSLLACGGKGEERGDASGVTDPLRVTGPSTLGPGASPNLLLLKSTIETAASTTTVAADVIAGVLWAESRADVDAQGGGLMQIGDAEFAAMKQKHAAIVGTIADANANVMAGAFYLLERAEAMQSVYGRSDLGIALRAYNSGDNGVDPHDLRHLPSGTGDPNYVTHVESFVVIIQSGNGTLPP